MFCLNRGFFKLLSVIATTISLSAVGFSQSISRPNPDSACFVQANELQDITVNISGDVITNGTTFVLRLSNKSGGFNTNSIIVAETTNSGNNINFIDFSYPTIDGEGTTLGSDEYRLRVEQLNGTLQSQRSNQFSAFFYDGTVLQLDPRVLCEFGQLRAIPDDLPEYVWHRVTNSGGDQIIEGESTSTLEADVEGQYYFTPPLGNCAGFLPEARSNFVTVFEALETQVPDFSIAISAGSSPFCADESSITLTSSFIDTDFSYQWVRDDVALPGETNPTITVSNIESEGTYLLEISDDSRRSQERCATQSDNRIFVDLNNPFINFTDDQELIVLDIPGEEEFLDVEVSGQNPIEITWFKDDVAIENSNTTRIAATGPGEYRATVTGSSCTINEDNTGDDPIQVISIDNLNITLNYDNPNYTPCAFTQIGLSIESITTEVNSSIITLNPNKFPADSIVWINNGEELPQFAGQRILINDAGGNGNYNAQISIGLDSFTSNNLEVQLNPGDLSIEATSLELNESNPVSTLSVPLPNDLSSSQFLYQWFRRDDTENGGRELLSTDEIYEVEQQGIYFVELTFVEEASSSFTNCPPQVLDGIGISLEPLIREIPNVITPNGSKNTRWQLPAEFTNQPNINVQIISSSGVEVLNQNSYNGNWPDGELLESVYYYIISENNNPLEKGSITIIR